MRRKIRNYDGPRAGYVLAGDLLLKLDDPRAILTLADSALILSLGPTPKADEYTRLAEKREIHAST
jgi:hypothetical protein